MKHAKDYIMIENHEDFLKHWNDNFKRFDHQIMEALPTTYPAFYKHCPNLFEPCYCGSYETCEKEDFINALNQTIKDCEENLKNLKIFEKTLKNA